MPIKRYYNNIQDAYKESTKEGLEVEYSLYAEIVKGFLKFLANKLLETGEVTLPCRLGNVCIRGYKQKIKLSEHGIIKGAAPDWKGTKQLWEESPKAKKNKQIVYFLNEETEGVLYSYIWIKKVVNLANKSMYKLRFTRANKKALSNLIREGKEYILKD